MDFGRSTICPKQGWQLPEEDPKNRSAGGTWKIHVGCPLWGNPAWVGRLYPKGTTAKQFLPIYAQNFDCIEYNGSFYHLPSDKQVVAWLEKITPGFMFCPKVPRAISHEGASASLVEDMVRVFQLFGDVMGLGFLQMPPSFKIRDGEKLKRIVAQVRGRIPLAVELRHPSWLENGILHPKVRSYFEKNNLYCVIVDTPGRRDVLHSTWTGDQVLIRFLATGDNQQDDIRLMQWCERLKIWRERGLRRAFFFCHQPEDRRSPELAQRFINLYNAAMGENLPLPVLESQRQPTLF